MSKMASDLFSYNFCFNTKNFPTFLPACDKLHRPFPYALRRWLIRSFRVIDVFALRSMLLHPATPLYTNSLCTPTCACIDCGAQCFSTFQAGDLFLFHSGVLSWAQKLTVHCPLELMQLLVEALAKNSVRADIHIYCNRKLFQRNKRLLMFF